MKIKLIILAVILAVAAIVVGIAYGMKGTPPSASEGAESTESVTSVDEESGDATSVGDTSGGATSEGTESGECVHEYEDTIVAATCTADGYTEHKCTKCEYTYRDETEALGHNFVKGATTNPTYEREGYTEYTCSRCGTVEKRDTVPVLIKPDTTCAHDYKDIVHSPTCTDKGYTEHTCKKCGGSYNDSETPVVAHSFIAGNIIAPTYEADGYTEYICAMCGITEKRDIVAKLVKPADNTYVDTVVAPTCDEKGYTVRKYNADGREERINETAALGHSYIDTIQKATCTADGYVEHRCTRCGDTKRDTINALTHNYINTVITPTCVDNGYTIHTCENCGDEYRDNETAALGHTYRTVVKAPTCTTDGVTTHTCTRCGRVYTDNEVNKLGHSFIADSVVMPTVTARGYTVYKCTRCGATEKRDYVDKLPEPESGTYTDTVVAPTCTEEGYTRRVHNDGRVEIINRVDATGHNLVFYETVQPTCTQSGYDTFKCTRCDDKYNAYYKPALGHNYTGAWIVETPATTTADGNEYQLCSRCGGKQYRLIPRIGGDGVVKTDIYEFAHYEAGRLSGERNVYEANTTSPNCIMIIIDYSLEATVVHTGYLAFRVTFTDDTGTLQVIDVRYEYDDEEIYENYSCRTLKIQADGSYTIRYSGRLS